MKIWVLTENTACEAGIQAEHGLSLYIETEKKRILFDMGQSSAFAENAKKLGLDLSDVDIAVLSHGHYDHGGGMETFLKINSKADVYVSQYAFGDHYNASDRYIGLNQSLKNRERLVHVTDSCSLGQGMMLLSCNEKSRLYSTDSAGLQKMRNGSLVPDDFLHEQYLVIEEQGKRVCFSGCSHKGILNILQWIDCDVLIGGFHFMKLDPAGETLRMATALLSGKDTVFYTCHCTGHAQYESMKSSMGQKLHYLAAGSCLEL